MILACPACRTSYLVDEGELNRPAGRTVRCASCGHTWHRPPPLETRDKEPLTPPAAPRIEPGLDVPPRPGPLPVPTSQRHVRRRLAVGWGVLGAIFVLLTLAIIAAIIARKEVVAMWPATARLYALAELSAAPPGPGLEVAKIAPTRTAEGLVIEGAITNPGSSAAASGSATRSGREGDPVQDHRSADRSVGAGRNHALQNIVRPSRRGSDRRLGDIRPPLSRT